ncbi:transcriptional regulator [Capnocytophaga cynodegmi]|uniref:helix-turn-helix domain-containing protein n=1 Tax=Capnocytophaga cynodegmi TaxID=28189 RepID=UPI001ACAEC1E|nr:helix-turn-helix transcriptional regulator [Capnocytophaga cynodegmi]GIM51977.1 transcriptional regulator [Capnocytophaga cynodegmi]
MNTIFTIGIFLSSFLSILLFTKKGKTLSDNILGTWLIFISVHLLSYYMYYLGYWQKYPHLVGITHPFPLLYAPFLYLYVVFSLRADQRFHLRDYLHFVPFVVTYLCMFPFFFGYTAEQKQIIDNENFNSSYQYFFVATFLLYIILGIVYSVLAYKKITNYQNLISQNFAYKDTISLQWLRFIILGIGIIFLSVTIILLLQYVFNLNFGFNSDLIGFVLIVLLVTSMGFLGIRQQGIFGAKNIKPQDIIIESKPTEYRKSGLKQTEAQAIHQQLLTIMDSEKLYLEPKLTLGQLAEQVGVSTNNLSQVINQYEEKNFYDFVNSYRIKEFIQRTNDPKNKNLNILAIAFDSGFNSKSSFNQVFKKFTGETPSEFIKSRNT